MPANIEKEFATLAKFIEVYCHNFHETDGNGLCAECAQLAAYGRGRLENCPYDPKPKCKDCETHCYRPNDREKIKKIMHYSGIYFAKRGRVDWLIKYLLH